MLGAVEAPKAAGRVRGDAGKLGGEVGGGVENERLVPHGGAVVFEVDEIPWEVTRRWWGRPPLSIDVHDADDRREDHVAPRVRDSEASLVAAARGLDSDCPSRRDQRLGAHELHTKGIIARRSGALPVRVHGEAQRHVGKGVAGIYHHRKIRFKAQHAGPRWNGKHGAATQLVHFGE